MCNKTLIQMKTHRTFSTLLLEIALFLSGSVVAAQDKESEQKKKQAEMQQEMQTRSSLLTEQEQLRHSRQEVEDGQLPY